jgi:ferredoxin
MRGHSARPYRRHARLLYCVFSWGLAALSHAKPLFLLALRLLTRRRHSVKGHILPLNAPVGRPEQDALGREVLARLIEESTAVAAMNECMCRAVGGCKEYPVDLGCLVLGSEAARVHPGLGREVGREEAMAVVDRAIGLGLTPMVIHFKGDSVLWSLDHRRMLTVCFCCPCHCLIRQSAGKRASSRGITGLPGVAVALDLRKCAGCGRCAGACFTGALTIEGGRVRIDRARCVACGRCAMACARGALTVDLEGDFDAGPVIREYESRTEADSVFRS